MAEDKTASTIQDSPKTHTWQSGLNNGKCAERKRATQSPKQPNTTRILEPPYARRNNQIRKCPECNSTRLYKDGLRYLPNGKTVQRWLCRECYYRFSQQKPLQKNQDWQINTASTLLSNRQVCDEPKKQAYITHPKGMKSLAEVETRQETAQREGTKPNQAIIKGLLTKFLAFLEKEAYAKDCTYPKYLKKLAKLGANLSDPEDVKKIIGQQSWKNGTKMLAVYAYDAFTKMEKITWTPPKYKQEENIPFVPNEEELDQLIAACNSRRMATFLQTLKETYADPGEVLKLRWIDINGEIITINNPVKGHLPGQIKISQKLIAMLNSLPKKSDKIFPTSYQSIENSFLRIRKKTAERLKNPRLSAVQFRSFRHWGGSMIAHYTNGNVLTVKKLLRHKSITSTMKYITMLDFKDDDEFDVATATTVEEIKQLASLGFQKFDEIKGIHIYRKPKRFNAKR